METNNECFSCDYCHRVGTGITIINGFKMCHMCLAEYQHKSGENNKLREELGKQARLIIYQENENAKLKIENTQLKSELEELKQNVIVPKFKVGDVIWIIKRIKKEVANGKIIKQYSYFNGGTPENLRNVNRWRIRLKNNSEVTKKEYELFYTREEAEEALRKLEEKENVSKK